MTRTRLVSGIASTWDAAGLPANEPEDIARVILGVASDSKVNGATMYVEGGRAWNVEAGLLETRPQWLGERQARQLDEGTRLMGGGEHWTAGQQK